MHVKCNFSAFCCGGCVCVHACVCVLCCVFLFHDSSQCIFSGYWSCHGSKQPIFPWVIRRASATCPVQAFSGTIRVSPTRLFSCCHTRRKIHRLADLALDSFFSKRAGQLWEMVWVCDIYVPRFIQLFLKRTMNIDSNISFVIFAQGGISPHSASLILMCSIWMHGKKMHDCTCGYTCLKRF